MPNSFPSLPVGGMELTGVSYKVTFPGSFTVTPDSALSFAGVSTTAQSWFGAGSWGVTFTFDLPGQFGSFDQGAAEAGMIAWLSTTALAMSEVTGVPANDISQSISVSRVWRWSDGGTGKSELTEDWSWA